MPIGTNSIFHVEVATIVTERLTCSFETARCRSFLEKKKICGAFAARTENELNCWVGSLVSLNTKVADRIPVSFKPYLTSIAIGMASTYSARCFDLKIIK